MLKGAILGFTDDAAHSLAPVFSRPDAGLAISAVCEEDPGLLAGAGRLLPDAALYRGTEDFFSKSGGLDFALVRGPAEKRFKTALRALENQLHVACETPFCFSTTEFETLRGEAEKRERTLFSLQPWERSAVWLAVDKVLSGNLLGEINFAEVQALEPGPAPAEGVTAAYGWRAFSMLLAMVRRPPSAMEARLSPRPSAAAAPDATAAFHVHFGGADGFVRLASGAHAPLLRAAAHGDKGRLELDGRTLRLDIKDMPPETIELRQGLSAGPRRPEWLSAELENFRKEIAGELPRGSGLRNSRYCVKLLKNACYSAGLNSAAVPL